MLEIKHIIKALWQPILIGILLLLLLSKGCNNSKTTLADTKTFQKESKNYYDEFIKEKSKRQLLEEETQQTVVKYNKDLLYWKSRKQISKTMQPINNVIDCNDTIKKITEIAYVNDSLCEDLVNTHQKLFNQKDSIILFTKKEIFNLENSLTFKQKETDGLNENLKITTSLLRKEKTNKWFWKLSTIGVSSFLIYKTIK